MSLFTSLILGFLFIRMLVNVGKSIHNRKMPNLGPIIIFGILGFFTLVPMLTRPNEHPELDLDVSQITTMTLSRANDSTIVSERLELLGQANDQSSFNQLATILRGCQRHRRNHPNYTKRYILDISYAGKTFPYALRIDSDAENGGIDLSPFEEDGNTIYSLGVYRCNGLNEFLEQLSGTDLSS